MKYLLLVLLLSAQLVSAEGRFKAWDVNAHDLMYTSDLRGSEFFFGVADYDGQSVVRIVFFSDTPYKKGYWRQFSTMELGIGGDYENGWNLSDAEFSNAAFSEMAVEAVFNMPESFVPAAKKGSTLHLKMTDYDGDVIHAIFSLSGFTAAHNNIIK